jgi:hypothetical protein
MSVACFAKCCAKLVGLSRKSPLRVKAVLIANVVLIVTYLSKS